MGYTHYFPQKKEIKIADWKKICIDFNSVLEEEKNKFGIKLTSNADNGKIIDEDEGFVSLNGVDDEEHETFYITQLHSRDFNFCKTAYKPYDKAVVRMLLLLNHYCPDSFEISSDGEFDDWKDGALDNFKLFGYGFIPPERILSDSEDEFEEFKRENSINQSKVKNRIKISSFN